MCRIFKVFWVYMIGSGEKQTEHIICRISWPDCWSLCMNARSWDSISKAVQSNSSCEQLRLIKTQHEIQFMCFFLWGKYICCARCNRKLCSSVSCHFDWHDNRSSGPESVKKIQLSEESTDTLWGISMCCFFYVTFVLILIFFHNLCAIQSELN